MDEKILESSIERLKSAKRILVVLPKFLTLDTAASSLALTHFLKAQSKEVTLASSAEIPKQLDFLKKGINIEHNLKTNSVMIVKVNTEEVKLGELTYEMKENAAHIFLTPKEGMFNESDITVEKKLANFDLIITIGAASWEELGDTYLKNTDAFFKTPSINIDVQGANEYFGSFNLVDVTSLSNAEIIFELLKTWSKEQITDAIATALLSGIISKTHSFQDVRTNPKVFTLAAELMDLGGDHQEAVQHIFKTKPLPLLQLWGRSLAKLKSTEVPGVLLSRLSKEDLEKTDFLKSGLDISNVLNELIENVSGFKVISIILEQDNKVNAYLALHPQVNPQNYFKESGRSGSVSSSWNFYLLVEQDWSNVQVLEVEKNITQALKKLL